jgi:hypothetical protein
VRVSSTSLVHVDRNRYSVDCRYAGKTVSLRTYADRVVIMAEGKIVGEHVRGFLTAMASAIAWSAAASSALRSVRGCVAEAAKRSKTYPLLRMIRALK